MQNLVLEAVPTPNVFRALVSDATIDRANRFLLTGKSYSVRIVRTEEETTQCLEEKAWDVLFVSLYLGSWDRHLALVNDIVKAYHAEKLKLVICYTPITIAGIAFMAEMKKAKIPAKWYPYDYAHPSRHVEWRN
jgi:hypothetical protein